MPAPPASMPIRSLEPLNALADSHMNEEDIGTLFISKRYASSGPRVACVTA